MSIIALCSSLRSFSEIHKNKTSFKDEKKEFIIHRKNFIPHLFQNYFKRDLQRATSELNQKAISYSLMQPEPCKIDRFFSHRMDVAKDLVEKIEKVFGIVLKGKKIIDVGTRSGENALMMQNAGADVVAIDPDDSEFYKAVDLGFFKESLFKATLEQYIKLENASKFDLATVFLWNVPCEQREVFAQSLREVINENGAVIIGCYEDVFNKELNLNLIKLMKKYFKLVLCYKFPYSLNATMLECR